MKLTFDFSNATKIIYCILTKPEFRVRVKLVLGPSFGTTPLSDHPRKTDSVNNNQPEKCYLSTKTYLNLIPSSKNIENSENYAYFGIEILKST